MTDAYITLLEIDAAISRVILHLLYTKDGSPSNLSHETAIGLLKATTTAIDRIRENL